MGKTLDELQAEGLTGAKLAPRRAADDLVRYSPEYVEALVLRLSQRIDDLEARLAALEGAKP